MTKTAFIFPGQGSQFAGMGRDFYERYDTARRYYDMACDILDFDIKSISFGIDEDLLKDTRYTQPAVFVLSVIISELLKEKNIIPDITAGHSLGEYAALVTAGVINFRDALSIVKIRGEEMQQAAEKNPGTMAAILGLDCDTVEDICRRNVAAGPVQVANYNSPLQTVISGVIDGVRSAMRDAKDAGAKMVKELSVSGAFHSNLMIPAVDPLKAELIRRDFSDAVIPVIPNVTAEPEVSGDQLRSLLVQQVTSPVRWSDSVEVMKVYGVTRFIEAGPGKVLKGLVRSMNKEAVIQSAGTVDEFEEF